MNHARWKDWHGLQCQRQPFIRTLFVCCSNKIPPFVSDNTFMTLTHNTHSRYRLHIHRVTSLFQATYERRQRLTRNSCAWERQNPWMLFVVLSSSRFISQWWLGRIVNCVRLLLFCTFPRWIEFYIPSLIFFFHNFDGIRSIVIGLNMVYCSAEGRKKKQTDCLLLPANIPTLIIQLESHDVNDKIGGFAKGRLCRNIYSEWYTELMHSL